MAVKTQEKVPRALNAIKEKMLEFTTKILLKIFDSVIQPIALYGSEVWGTLGHSDTPWYKQNLNMQNSADTFYTKTNKCM